MPSPVPLIFLAFLGLVTGFFWRSPSHGAKPLGLPSSGKVHTSVRRPAQRTPRPQNLHSDPDLQIRQPCGIRGRGGAGGGAAGRTPKRKFGKLRIRAWPEPRSQRPGLKLGRQAEQNFLSGHTSYGDQGCSEQRCGKK